MSEASDAWEARVDEEVTPEYQRKRKHVRGHYLCTVNPGKRKVFNFKKGRQVKLNRWGSGKFGYVKDEQFPLMGYACPVCETFGSNTSHFLIGKVSMCEYCAIKKMFP